MRLAFLVPFLAGIAFTLAACADQGQAATPGPTKEVPPDLFETLPKGQLPKFLDGHGPEVFEAYTFAVENYDELRFIPCYCGCVALGHTDNASCAIKSMNRDGTVTFTSHAADCPICLGTTRDVMRLHSEGKSLTEMRDFIDAKYRDLGPGTKTMYPKSQ